MKGKIEDGAHTAGHKRGCRAPTADTRLDSSRGPKAAPPDVRCSLRPLVALSVLVGVPPCRPRWSAMLDAASRLYSLAVVASLVYLGYNAATSVTETYSPNCYSYYVPKLVGCSMVCFAACASVLALLVAHDDWLCAFSTELRRVDDLLGVDKWKAHHVTKFYLFASLGLLMTAYVGNVAWDIVYASHYDALIEIIIFVIIVTFEQFLTFALIIRNRFQFLNEAVMHSFTSQQDMFGAADVTVMMSGQCHLSAFSPPSKQSTWPASCDQLLSIKVAHNKLTKLAGALNDVYTVPITAMVLQALVSAVQVIFNVLLHLLDDDSGNDVLVLPDMCYLLMTMTHVVALACCCQSTASQARRTTSIAEDLIVANAAAGGSEPVSQQLRQLSRQVRRGRVAFSACSLFPVDASLLTAFLSTVATYTIILLQFVVSNKGCPLHTFPQASAVPDYNETTSPAP